MNGLVVLNKREKKTKNREKNQEEQTKWRLAGPR